MSNTIDQRVVEMQFDNRQFENGVQTSMSTIERLKNSLIMNGVGKGFEAIGSSVETVKTKISALQVMAVTALANITNSAVNAGKNMVNSLVFKAPTDGLKEYELQINSTQTIMANTGRNVKDVNKSLDALNDYADLTIYNFAEMTKNAGMFTSAGLGLEDTMTALKGVGNWAAYAGANSQQMGNATYQLGQALNAGAIRLQDWMSIEKSAGMAGKLYKDAFIETSRELGTGVDKAIAKNGDFRSSLKQGWLTTEVFMKTMQKFADNQSMTDAATKVKTFTQLIDTLQEAVGTGWGTTWRTIIGDYEEAKEMWTGANNILSDMINKSSDARNAVLKDWKEMGGRTALIEAIKNSFEALLSVIKPIKEAFTNIFPPITGKQLADLSNAIRDFTSHLKLSDETSDKVKRTFQGLFSILDIGRQIFSGVFSLVGRLIGNFSGLGGGVLNVSANIGDMITNFAKFLRETNVIQKVFKTIGDVIEIVIKTVKSFYEVIKEKINLPTFESIHKFLDTLRIKMGDVVKGASSMGENFASAVDRMKERISKSGIVEALGKIKDGFVKLGTNIVTKIFPAIGKALGTLFDSIIHADFDKVFSMIESLFMGGALLKITDFIGSFKKIGESVSGFMENVSSILDSVRGSLEAYQTNLKAKTLLMIAGAVGILAISLVSISGIDAEKMNTALKGITVMMADLAGFMAVFNKFGGIADVKTYGSMILMAEAVKVLSKALKNLAELNMEQLKVGLAGITGLMADLVAAMMTMSLNQKAVGKGAVGMVIFAGAIKILSSACKDLSSLSWDELKKGLAGVTVLMTEIALFLNFGNTSAKTIGSATGIIILAAAIKILASACKTFSGFSVEELVKGLSAVGVLLAELALFQNFSKGGANMIGVGVGMIALAQALKMLSGVVKEFGNLSFEQIGKGLGTLAGALTAITLAVNLMPKNMIGIGAGMVIVAQSINMVSDSIAKNSKLSWIEIAKGLVAIGGALGIMAIGVNAMSGAVAGAGAMIIAATAIGILTPALFVLSSIPIKGMVVALGALAATFTIFGVAGMALAPLAPIILSLTASFALFGAGVLALGVGLAAIGAGVLAISAALAGLSGSLVVAAGSIKAILKIVIDVVIDTIPYIAKKLAEGLAIFVKAIADNSVVILQSLKELILKTVEVLVECIPPIVDGALKLIDEVLKQIVAYTPSIANSIVDFVIAILDVVNNRIPELVDKAMSVVVNFFNSVADSIMKLDTGGLQQGIIGIAIMTALLTALSFIAGLIPEAMIGVVGLGAFIAEVALIVAAIGALGQIPGFNWLIGEGGKLLENLGNALGKFVGGFVGGILEGVTDSLPRMAENLSDFMNKLQPFVDGASRIEPSMLDGVKALADVVITFTKANIINGIGEFFSGGTSLAEFAQELASFGSAMKEYANSVAGLDAKLVTESAIAAESLAEMAKKLPNSGGVLAYWVGDNSLADFARSLIPFGIAMKNYARSISGIDSNAVTNSATAASSLAEMAKKLPNSGGALAYWVGDNNLGDFAKGLIPFGVAMKTYSRNISGIDSNAITNSAIAAQALAELAKNIPNSGGLVSLFSGENDIKTFGEKLASFGESISKYHSSISGINTSTLSSITSEFEKLVNLAKGISNVDTSGLSTFGKNLTDLGKSGIDGFIKSFTDANSKVRSTISNMLNIVSEVIDNKKSSIVEKFKSIITDILSGAEAKANEFQKLGKKLADGLEKGIKENKEIKSSITNIFKDILSELEKKLNDFKKFGENVMEHLKKGINSKSSDMSKSILDVVKKITTDLETYTSKFQNAGVNLVQGFINGMDSKIADITKKSSEIGTVALNSLKQSLEIHSPSKKTEEAGINTAEGFIKGMEEKTTEVAETSKIMAQAAEYGITEAMVTAKNNIYQVNMESRTDLVNHFATMYGINEKGIKDLLGQKEQQVQEEEKKNHRRRKSRKEVQEETKKIQEEEIVGEDIYWKTLMDVRAKAQEQAKDQQNSYATFQNDIVTKTKELINQYTDALKSNTDALMSRMNIFDDVTKKDTVNGSTLKSNLLRQIELTKEYSDTIMSLNKRLTDGNFKDAINKLGMDSIEELKALNRMSDAQLTDYVGIYDVKYAMCQNLAEFQMSKIKSDTETKLTELYGGVNVGYDALVKSFDGSFESIKKYVGEAVGVGKNLADGIATGIKESTSNQEAMKDQINSALEAAKVAADIHSPSGLFKDQIGKNISEGIAVGITENSENVKNSITQLNSVLLETLQTSVEGFKTKGGEIALAIAEGFNTSSTTMSTNVTNTVSAMIAIIPITINTNLPSIQASASAIVSTMVTGIQSKVNELSASITNMMNQLVLAVSKSDNSFKSTIDNILSHILSSIRNKYNDFYTEGETLMIKVLAGIRAKENEVVSKVKSIVEELLNSIKNKNSDFENAMGNIFSNSLKVINSKNNDFKDAGKAIAENMRQGINSVSSDVKNTFDTVVQSLIQAIKNSHNDFKEAGKTMVSEFTDAIKNSYNDFYDAGKRLVEGFTNAIKDNMQDAIDAAEEMAREASNAAEEELDINSPSKVFYRIGKYAVAGFVNSFNDSSVLSEDAGRNLARNSVDSFSNAISRISDVISSDLDLEPTIRPVLDLSNVQTGAKKLSTLLSSNKAYQVDAIINRQPVSNIQNGVTTTSGNVYQFTQNNYSPKALSRIDIYRQTRNQFSSIERASNI